MGLGEEADRANWRKGLDGLPMYLRLHQEPYVAERDGEAVVAVEPCARVGQRL